MMQQVIRLSFIVLSIFALRTYGTIRISGGNSYTYDPRNPSEYILTCNHDNDDKPTWTRDGERVEEVLVLGNGRLRLNQNTIGTDDPQKFEGLYRCESGGETSAPVALFVVPRRIDVNTTVQHPLEGENVAINCSLRFGSLRNNWTVTWNAEDRNEDILPSSWYHTRTEPSFQLVINNATINYERAIFRCRANLDGRNEVVGQRITLNLYHDANVTTFPENPVVVSNEDHNGIVAFEIKAYPPPTIKLCYNGTCELDPARSRVQHLITHNDDETMHEVNFIIHNMNEYDNGNVTLGVVQPERGVNFNHTVMLFLPYKIDVTMEGNIVSNSDVPLRIRLRRAIHFDYEIEFVDNDEVIGMMEGEKGKETFHHTITVRRDTELMARLKIGEVRGPESDAVTIDVTEAPESESDDNTVTIVAVIATAVVLLTLIVSATLIIIMVVSKTKICKKDTSTDGGDVENGTGKNQMQPSTQNERHHMTINPINQPQIAVIAATPHNMNGSFAHNVYPPGGPYFPRPQFGSTSSDHSSAPSRKSSGGTGYESGLGSAVYPCGFSPYPSNVHCSRCACNCEPDVYHGFHHHQQQQEEPQQPVQHDHNGSAMASQQLTASSNSNLTPARPPMRRNSSDPNISRHKPSPCRPLDEQTSNKLLSSSSVV